MCGIAGFTRRSKGASKGVAERITEAISHRGPDQQGVFEGSEATLCAVRLKIIDLDGGDQPILSDNRDTAIVFNGEIYNHQEVRGELESLGHRFHSNCDTETVLRAYLEWDTACFSRMRGMFALALWTESKKRLVLVRDPNVFLLGEDIGAYGGAFKVTAGFFEHFGEKRVVDTPISEAAIVGAAIGAGLMGVRPVAEMQFADFITCGFDQIVNFA